MATSAVSGVNQVNGNYYRTKVVDNGDGTFDSTLFRTDAQGTNEVPIAAYATPSGGGPVAKAINTTNASPEEQQLLADPNSQLNQVRRDQIKSTEETFFPEEQLPPSEEQKDSLDKVSGGSGNQAEENPNNQNNNANPNKNNDEFAQENSELQKGTRTKYTHIKYPSNLSSDYQDCIKFAILEYKPSLASKESTQNLSSILSGRPKSGQNILGSITLPIPAGIQDSNTVDWQSDQLNVAQTAFGKIASEYIGKGAEAGNEAASNVTKTVQDTIQSGEAQKVISAKLSELAVGANSLMQRTEGAILNKNLELLFNSPSLRSFSFNFKLTPRNPKEAKDIMTIIRYFKQAMAVKRSKTSLLLKTPRTFQISYLTSNKDHPYLNKFKECALTGFNVDYTPEGQYMTYMSSKIEERSMIAYQISLTFQELEPIFDDEYGSEENIQNIGY